MIAGVVRPAHGRMLLEDFWDLMTWAEYGGVPPRDRWVQDLSMQRQIDSFSGLL